MPQSLAHRGDALSNRSRYVARNADEVNDTFAGGACTCASGQLLPGPRGSDQGQALAHALIGSGQARGKVVLAGF